MQHFNDQSGNAPELVHLLRFQGCDSIGLLSALRRGPDEQLAADTR